MSQTIFDELINRILCAEHHSADPVAAFVQRILPCCLRWLVDGVMTPPYAALLIFYAQKQPRSIGAVHSSGISNPAKNSS